MQDSKLRIHNLWASFCILSFAFLIAGCDIPNLEKPECTQTRDLVKRFYSFHFGNDMRPSAENLKARQAFLTTKLFDSLSTSTDEKLDYFTASEEYPKAFRIGSCTVVNSDSAILQVLLLWHNDTASKQKEVKVIVNKSDDKWLIDRVTDK